jgi:hypothetical protein
MAKKLLYALSALVKFVPCTCLLLQLEVLENENIILVIVLVHTCRHPWTEHMNPRYVWWSPDFVYNSSLVEWFAQTDSCLFKANFLQIVWYTKKYFAGYMYNVPLQRITNIIFKKHLMVFLSVDTKDPT